MLFDPQKKFLVTEKGAPRAIFYARKSYLKFELVYFRET